VLVWRPHGFGRRRASQELLNAKRFALAVTVRRCRVLQGLPKAKRFVLAVALRSCRVRQEQLNVKRFALATRQAAAKLQKSICGGSARKRSCGSQFQQILNATRESKPLLANRSFARRAAPCERAALCVNAVELFSSWSVQHSNVHQPRVPQLH
jgi:hypothetical protein